MLPSMPFLEMKTDIRDRLLIMGRGKGTKWKIVGPKHFAPPKTDHPPPFKEWKLFQPPSVWLKLHLLSPPTVFVALHLPIINDRSLRITAYIIQNKSNMP